MNGLHLYAVVEASEPSTLNVPGLDSPVRLITNGDLAAVVGPSNWKEYQGLDRREAMRALLTHQQVAEMMLAEYRVLPVKFGTVLPDEAHVYKLLQQGADLFTETLRDLAGYLQMEVVVLWDLKEVISEIGKEAPIVRLKAQLAAVPVTELREGQVLLGRTVETFLKRRRAELEACLLPRLAKLARDFVTIPVTDDRIILNVGLLLDEQGEDCLDEQLEILDAEFEAKLQFRVVGPLPPHSFATVEVQVLFFEVLDEAHRILELEAETTLHEIKKAYRRLANQLHPDHNPGDQSAETRMSVLTEAYKLLITYYKNHRLDLETNGAWQERSGDDGDAVTDALLITVKRREPACVLVA